MNLTNITIDLNKLNQSYLTGNNNIDIKELVCYQLNGHLIKIGFIIVISYLVYTWLSYFFFNFWYKRIYYDKDSKIGKFIGNLDLKDTRLYWDTFIRDRFAKVMIGYIVMVIYFLIV